MVIDSCLYCVSPTRYKGWIWLNNLAIIRYGDNLNEDDTIECPYVLYWKGSNAIYRLNIPQLSRFMCVLWLWLRRDLLIWSPLQSTTWSLHADLLADGTLNVSLLLQLSHARESRVGHVARLDGGHHLKEGAIRIRSWNPFRCYNQSINPFPSVIKTVAHTK